jgi:hypothetical protein
MMIFHRLATVIAVAHVSYFISRYAGMKTTSQARGTIFVGKARGAFPPTLFNNDFPREVYRSDSTGLVSSLSARVSDLRPDTLGCAPNGLTLLCRGFDFRQVDEVHVKNSRSDVSSFSEVARRFCF